jgi:hypothetical protein
MGGMVKKVTAQKEGGMKKEISICEICKSRAENDEQKRKENWLEIKGGTLHGVSVWLEKPRFHKKGVCDSFMLTVGWQSRDYHFCSIKCLVKALRGKHSI